MHLPTTIVRLVPRVQACAGALARALAAAAGATAALPAVAIAAACSSPAETPQRSAARTSPSAVTAAPVDPAPAGCADRFELRPGLIAERVPFSDRGGCLTLVRIDPARHDLHLRTAAMDGPARPAPRWAADFGLVAVTNTSMFHDDQRSIGILRDARSINSDRDNPKLGGFFAFDPVDLADPPVLVTGRDCPGFDLGALRRSYRGLIQNYRMLDCDGRPLRWADTKIYSAAAIGLDRAGHVVFLHTRTPFRMTELNHFIARPELGLVAALYVEGGPEASLYADGPMRRIEEIGSFETGFFDDSNTTFWPIPNVLGVIPRAGGTAP